MNLTEVLSTFGQIDHNSQQVVLCFSGNDFWRIDLKQFLYVKHVSRFADSIADKTDKSLRNLRSLTNGAYFSSFLETTLCKFLLSVTTQIKALPYFIDF